MNKLYALLIATLGLGFVPGLASASSGTVTGTFNFLQKQENCGTGTGVKYPCTQYNTKRPVRGALVRVRRASDDKVLGKGYTTSSGAFSINWTDGTTSTSGVSVTVVWLAEHQDGRFRVVGSTGNTYTFWIAASGGGEQKYTAPHGKTLAVGSKDWGNNPHANVYDGARLLWNSIEPSSRLNAYFGNGAPKCPAGIGGCTSRSMIAINDTGTGNTAGNGCVNGNAWADAGDNYVCLSNDSTGQYANLSRVMHELGHIAEYVSNRDQRRYPTADYRRDDAAACTGPTPPLSCNTHSLNSSEHHSPQYTESVATHFAHVGLYSMSASQPFTCVATSACTAANGFNLESRPASCAAEHRWELTSMRFWWDLYDSTSDSSGGNTDGLSREIWEVADTIHAFDPGWKTKNRDEVWSSTTSGADDKDGHSTLDHVQNWQDYGTDATAVLNLNCAPQGAD